MVHRESGLFALLFSFSLLPAVADASEDFEDVLGGVFMEFVSHGYNGQFFTNMDIGKMMALAVSCDELTPEQSVCDPTCGSGTLLLAAAKTCANKNQGKRPKCYGSDIDITCVKMTVINMLMNSIPGEIAWMNAITMEHWRSYFIDLILIRGMWLPSLRVTGAGETCFITRLEQTFEESPQIKEQIIEKTKPVQLSFGF